MGEVGAGSTTPASASAEVDDDDSPRSAPARPDGSQPTFLILRWNGPKRTTAIVVYALLIVAAVTRGPYLLFHGRFYAEEGSLHFPHMVEHPGLRSLLYVQTRTGYWNFFCDIATWVAARGPLAQAPIVTAWFSFAVLAFIVWVALAWPSDLLPTAASRIAAAVLLVVGTLAVPEVWMNSITAHAYLGMLAVLLLFVDIRKLKRRDFLLGAGALVIGGFSGIYTCVLAPLFFARAFRERTARRITYAAIVCGAAIIELAVVFNSRASGKLAETKMVFPGLGTMIRDVGGWHFATFVFGGSAASSIHPKLDSMGGVFVLLALAVVVFLFLLAVLSYVPRTRVALMLIVAFVLEELLVNYGAHNGAGGRYAAVPIAILTLMLIHGAATTEHLWLARAATVLCGVVLVAGVANFWTTKTTLLRCEHCPQWEQQLNEFKAGRIDDVKGWPYPDLGWDVPLPVSVRSSAIQLGVARVRWQ